MSSFVNEFMGSIKAKDPNQPEFLQAVEEVMISLAPIVEKYPMYLESKVLQRIVEPERVIQFRIPWIDDGGNIQVNRGFRVQFNSAIGPYKGGLRFHPSVNLSILKFLGFEQTFKNSLTTLPMGGGKGGADFDPKGKSDNEIMKFCQSFMTELFRHIGPETDVPAGDIGVGGREIGYLFGQYKRLSNSFVGVLTGKGLGWGGSLIRPEATGYGVIYFAEEVLKAHQSTIAGKTIAISGFGNVAWGAVSKATELGAKVVTISGPDGYIYDPDGINGEKIEYMLELRNSNRDIVAPYAQQFGVEFFANKRPWEVKCDIAIPCATQNELNLDDAKTLLKNGVTAVIEAANMPCTAEAMDLFVDNKIIFAPGKAANSGGVAVSGLEMSQNSMKLHWSMDELDTKLHEIMKNIHVQCVMHGTQRSGYINYINGANIAGFIRVADAMLDQGVV